MGRALKLTLFLIMAFSLPWLTTSQSFADLVGQARVIDGDTLELAGQKVRLHGIDAPESNQLCFLRTGQSYPCGRHATKALTNLIGNQTIICKGGQVDRYGRLIGKCYRAEVDINQHMVLNGWALAYRTYSQDYVDAEATGRLAGLGIWQGQFVPPWDWRRGKRLAEPAKTEGRPCLIKANVNSRGKKIYHMPGGQFYDAVKIRLEQGDRCFDTQGEAEAAGFRRSSR